MKIMEIFDILSEDLNQSKIISVGTCIVRKNKNNNFEILLVKPTGNKNNIFGFPKGMKEPNEDEIETAYRETKEETGISNFEILENYRFVQEGKNKDIIIYLAILNSNKDLKNQIKKHDWENEIVKFFEIDNLPPIFKNQQEIASQIVKLLKKERDYFEKLIVKED